MTTSPFDTLLRTALIGLNQSSDYRHALPEHLQSLLTIGAFRSDADQLLQLLTLCYLEQELSRCPAPDKGFSELPPELENCLQPLTPKMEEAVLKLASSHPRLSLRLLPVVLFWRGKALPDALGVRVLESNDRQHGDLQVLAGSGRVRWMLELTPDWHNVLSSCRSDWATVAQQLYLNPATVSAEQLQYLVPIFGASKGLVRRQLGLLVGRLPGAFLFDFIQQAWGQARVDARTGLLQRLHGVLDWLCSPHGMAARDWLESLSGERATAVRQAWIQLRVRVALTLAPAQRSAAQHALLGQVQQALEQYLVTSDTNQLVLQVPEQLEASLQALGISDSASAFPRLSKPAARLGQLLQLAGPLLWATHMNCSVKDATQGLTSSRFGEEVGPFLWNSLLWYQETEAVHWLQKQHSLTKNGPCQQVLVEVLSTCPRVAHWYLETLASRAHWAPLEVEAICLAFVEAGLQLSPKASQAWWQARLRQSASLHRTSPDLELVRALLLGLPEGEELQPLVAPPETKNERLYEHYQYRCQLIQAVQALPQPLHTF